MENVQTWTTDLTESVFRVAGLVFGYLPTVLGSLALILIGWLVARALRYVTRSMSLEALERLARQRVARSKAVGAKVQQSHSYQSAPLVVGAIVYWTALLFFVAAAIEALGLRVVSEVVALIGAYLPKVLVAVIIVFMGLWVGEFVHAFLLRQSQSRVASSQPFSRALQFTVVLIFMVVAIGQLGIDTSILVTVLTTVFAAVLGGAGLAFGLGARVAAGNIIAARYVRRLYHPGDLVRMGELEGEISEITDSGVVLTTAGERINIPSARFLEEVTVLVDSGRP